LGHERVGHLPKTERWRGIVNSIGSYSNTENTIGNIASQTTKNVRNRFENIENDNGVFAAFKYLLNLTYCAKSDSALEKLAKNKIELPKNFSLYDLAYSIQHYVNTYAESREYSSFATQSMIDTVSEWAQQNANNQIVLFDSNNQSFDLWNKAANGAGFCELTRLIFSKFTERYLKYFLEREAAAAINNIYDRKQFNENLEKHIDKISRHAFETSKITQSFAAGWYNKETKNNFPSDEKIKGFLSFAFKKINSELIREENKDD
jgi:hypothetical protein